METAGACGRIGVGAGSRPADAAARNQPVALLLGRPDPGIGHAERAGYPLAQQFRIILAAGIGEQLLKLHVK